MATTVSKILNSVCALRGWQRSDNFCQSQHPRDMRIVEALRVTFSDLNTRSICLHYDDLVVESDDQEIYFDQTVCVLGTIRNYLAHSGQDASTASADYENHILQLQSQRNDESISLSEPTTQAQEDPFDTIQMNTEREFV